MAVVLLPYNPKHYDSLPPVIQAGRNAEPSGAIDALSSVLGPIFVKHSVHNELGIILLHNHFELGGSELLVQIGNAAVPWETSGNSSGLEHVLPAAWRFVDEGLAPYEFIYTKNHQSAVPILTPERYGSFLEDLRGVLKERALLGVLGLCILENKDIEAPAMFEVESGRSTITVDVDINPQKEDWFIHVIWQFGTDTNGSGMPMVFKKHKVAHKAKGDDHKDRHLTTKK